MAGEHKWSTTTAFGAEEQNRKNLSSSRRCQRRQRQWRRRPVTTAVGRSKAVSEVEKKQDGTGRRRENRTVEAAAGRRNLAQTQPKSDPCSQIYGSFNLDRGGWSVIPTLLLISNILILDYMLDCNACRFMGVDYIHLCDLSINWALEWWLNYWVQYGCPRACLGLYVLILYWDEKERDDYSWAEYDIWLMGITTLIYGLISEF